MSLSFKRITSSGKFIPEIDGLRFIAITAVVIYHYWCLIAIYDHHEYKDSIDFSFLRRLISHGNFGVELFFVISGFILGLPFCNYYLNGGKKINIKNYFIRRLTRLEPPYIISLVLFGLTSLFILKMNFEVVMKSFFSSLLYLHNFVFPGVKPILNGVAWSLEIEVQFYVLAPIIAYIFFSVKSKLLRRSLITSMILISVITSNYFNLGFVSIFNYLHYFLLGFLLCDFYLSDAKKNRKHSKFLSVFLFGIFISLWLFEKSYLSSFFYKVAWELYQLFIIFVLYYCILIYKQFKILANPIITNIGGMCYSIYLLHYPLIAFVSKFLIPIKFSDYSHINIGIYCIVYTIVIGIVCSIFYLLVEKPCMDKDWPKKLLNKLFL